MVGKDVDQVHAVGGRLLEPAGNARVLLAAIAPCGLGIDGVAHKPVREGRLDLADQRRFGSEYDVVPPAEVFERIHYRSDRPVPDRRKRANPERATHYGRVSEHGALGQRENIDTGGYQRLHRLGNGKRLTFSEPPDPTVLDEGSAVEQEAHELACVQRVAAGVSKDGLLNLRRQRPAGEE